MIQRMLCIIPDQRITIRHILDVFRQDPEDIFEMDESRPVIVSHTDEITGRGRTNPGYETVIDNYFTPPSPPKEKGMSIPKKESFLPSSFGSFYRFLTKSFSK